MCNRCAGHIGAISLLKVKVTHPGFALPFFIYTSFFRRGEKMRKDNNIVVIKVTDLYLSMLLIEYLTILDFTNGKLKHFNILLKTQFLGERKME